MYEFLKALSFTAIVALAYGIGVVTLATLLVWPFMQHRRKLRQLKRQVLRRKQLSSDS